MAKISRRIFLKDAATTIVQEKPTFATIDYIDPSNKTLPRHLAKTSTGLTEYTGLFNEAQILHLLRRTLLGLSKADVDFFKTKTMSEAVDSILNIPPNPPPPPLNNYGNNANTADPTVPFGQTWVNAAVNPNLEGARMSSFKSWWIRLMLTPNRNISEKMTLFWHNHFATQTTIVQDSRYVYKHHSLLRANCLGDFKELVKQVTIDPAMLVYLNGEDNTKKSPDENYGRELQELFTIGKDIAEHYTEDDVKAAARVLTGWRNSRTNIASFFDTTKHDTNNKQFSSFYNNTVINGRTGTNAGMDELNDMLNMIFAHQETSKYICRKLYRYFIYYVIDESVETNVIEPLAKAFRDSNYDIKVVVSKLLKSEHFFDPLNMGCMIKQPIDQVIGSSRMMELVFPDASNIQTQYAHWIYLQQFSALCGQDIGDPPNVAGWPAYYEDPQFYELWINSDTLPKRNLYNDTMLYNGFNRFSFKLIYDTISFVNQFPNPEDPNALISAISTLCHPVPLSQASKDTIKKAYLLSGQDSDIYWTDAWNTYKNNPTNAAAKKTITDRLQAMMKYMFGLAEYQLC
ncbi:MAG TPA: hypothetical protein DIU05_05930 [Bacteroidetes bacterium]|jgi:uncharacterized protein (DUF1800 family)|nr:hypothetical protein [Bacteroidota bacterium]